MIAIVHRLSTIARMDRLVVLDRGRITEQGTRDELLRRNGHYAALWQRQSGGRDRCWPLDVSVGEYLPRRLKRTSSQCVAFFPVKNPCYARKIP